MIYSWPIDSHLIRTSRTDTWAEGERNEPLGRASLGDLLGKPKVIYLGT
jgi:hypothetical protein